MVRKNYGKLVLALVVALVMFPSFAQQNKKSKEEDIVRLVKAKSIEQLEIDGENVRKSVAATFKHNGMTLSCDTALWNTDRKIINAFGHVKVRQDKVVITSEKLDYDIQLSVATFHGSLVEMKDDNSNTLRTENLDYYTKDSLAVFRDGAAMRSEDGQVIESLRGTYSAKAHVFNFTGKVNMFTDSVLLATDALEYFSDDHVARFSDPVDFWKGSNMLSALRGWYDRNAETFYFERSVHAMSPDQEVWCDSMYYYRTPNDVMMLGNVQMQDSSRNIMAVSEYMLYEDSLKQMTLRDEAAIAMETEHNGILDTAYCGGDEIVYYTLKRCDIPATEITAADERLKIFSTDPIGTYRAEAAAEAAKRAQEIYEKKMEDEHPGWKEQQMKLQAEAEKARQDSLAAAKKDNPDPKEQKGGAPAETADMPETAAPADISGAQADTSGAPAGISGAAAAADSLSNRDTTEVGFLRIKGTVQVFRKDLQVLCDSLEYTDLDSIARFYKDPIIWNEGNRQYSSDSLFALIRGGTMERAALENNAMIITQEDENLYDQIKSVEVMAYFNSKTELVRFDALGGADLLFYLEENGTLATANRVTSKMLTGTFKDGDIQRVTYYTETNNDAYPVAQMSDKDKRFDGFNWSPEKRPTSKEDISIVAIRDLERDWYEAKKQPAYPISEKYFPGYMSGVIYDLRHPKAPVTEPKEEVPVGPKTVDNPIPEGDTLALPMLHKQEETAAADTVPAQKDTLISTEVLPVAGQVPEETVQDTLASPSVPVEGSAVAVEEETAATSEVQPDPAAEARALKEAERRRKAEERAAARAERERILAEKDAAKAAAKEQKALDKKRRKTERAWIKQQKRISREQDILYKYVERYEKQRQREAGKVKPQSQ